MRRLVVVTWLTAVWVVLWEGVSAANVLSGLAVAGLLVTVFPVRRASGRVRLRPLAALRFAGYFAVKLVEANAIVAWEVLTPRNRISEGIVAIPLPPGPDGLVALVADAVSLTPGTVTVEVRGRPRVLYVHVLHLESAETTRREVLRLDRLARAAFVVESTGGAP
jgi:multicomponent Na+:H+ antiporter subunit E